MTEFERYERGVPCWVDLQTSDPEGARAFYGALFGWEFDIHPDPMTGHYTNALLDGKRVAGLGGVPADEGMPTAWTTYIASDDVFVEAKRIAEAGGQVVMEPMQVMDYGSMLIAVDPTGAAFGCWQGGNHNGSQLANVPGSFTWNEVSTRDTATARAFYENVFGYGWDDMSSPGLEYHVATVDGRGIAGVMATPAEAPAEMSSHWDVYWTVPDCDAALAQIEELGGKVVMPAIDSPFGRFAYVADPQGGFFYAMQLPAEDAQGTG